MFKNRKLEIKVVNAKKDQAQSREELSFETKAVIMSTAAHNVIYTIGKAMIAYVAVDTIRKVLIAKAIS